MKSYGLLVNGSLIESEEKKIILNPSNQTPVALVSISDGALIESAISSARIAFDSGPWIRYSIEERKTVLKKISAGILENAAELAALETANTGKPIKETTFMDIPSSAKAFDHVADNLESFLMLENRVIPNEAHARLVYEPAGVALIVVPWNYPLLIACWKLASALGSGNTVVLKPSSLTPLSILELSRIMLNCGLPKGVVNVINAGSTALGEKLFIDDRIDLISFTGSNTVGKSLFSATSKHVKKIIMELGGKSASIVFKDIDIDVAVNSALTSIFLNQGQMCTAMSRIIVEEEIYDSFVDQFVKKSKKMKIGAGEDFETQIGPLISSEQQKKIVNLVNNARKEGAEIISGGKIPEGKEYEAGFFYEPTVIIGITPEMEIFQEEVFGPVVCICKFSRVDEAIKIANDTKFGLASCIWTKDFQRAEYVASKINAGTIWVNTYGMFYNELPYGGFKQSGFGKELGKEGFLEYCRLKCIIKDTSPDQKPLVNYWYGF